MEQPIITAAGGLVQNNEGAFLLIYRRGFWDLPKGKLDPGESIPECALREVQEETGVLNLSIAHEITQTWHTYKQKNRILKKTYWYDMITSDVNLTPQLEEDIEEARWVDPQEFLNEEVYPKYGNIKDLVLTCLKMR